MSVEGVKVFALEDKIDNRGSHLTLCAVNWGGGSEYKDEVARFIIIIGSL